MKRYYLFFAQYLVCMESVVCSSMIEVILLISSIYSVVDLSLFMKVVGKRGHNYGPQFSVEHRIFSLAVEFSHFHRISWNLLTGR